MRKKYRAAVSWKGTKVIAALMLLVRSTEAAPFANLNFEASPNFPAGDYQSPWTVYSTALNGWRANIGTNVQLGACANEFILDAPTVALLTSSNSDSYTQPIEGQKSIFLQSTPLYWKNLASIQNVGISRTGEVPTNAQIIRFKARNPWWSYSPNTVNSGPVDVRLANQPIPLITVRSNTGDVEYAGDISAWAGQTAELYLGVSASNICCDSFFPESWAIVDSISFDPGVRLEIALISANSLRVSWPSNATASLPLALHHSLDGGTTSWGMVTNMPAYANGTNSVTLPIPTTAQFYRLKLMP